MFRPFQSSQVIRSLTYALLLLACTSWASAAGNAIAAVLDGEHAAGRFDGAVVVLKRQNVIASAGWGASDRGSRMPWQATSQTRYASVTKQVTALLILQDAAAGRIALDAPLARYLPLAPVWAGSVTIEHLLRHTSGLRERELPKQLPTDFPYRAATAPRQWARPAALAAAVCADAPVSVPGTQFAYGDCDYFWLGAVLEAVHGRTWDTLARERIAKPLGLRSWRAAAPGRDRTARGYVAGDKLEPPVGLWAYSSAAGLTGTLTDLARFEQALVSGSLLAPEWMARMFDGRAENQSHAMGSWAYDLPAANGAAVRFIERQGWVGGVKLAAVSVPAESLVLVLVSNDPDTVLDGPWNPRGLVSRLLEAARID